LQHIVAVELNTRKEIKVETLDLILTKDITEMINDGSTHSLNVLADFILRYTMLMRNKTQMKEALKAKQEEATPECRRKNQFPCALDIMTVHDVGFTWMQFKNHEKAWRDTVMNVDDDGGGGSGGGPEQDSDNKSRNKSLWSSSMGGRKNGGSVLHREGQEYYEKICSLLQTSRLIRVTKCFSLFAITRHNSWVSFTSIKRCLIFLLLAVVPRGQKVTRDQFQHSHER
jgi:hypothetical protein